MAPDIGFAVRLVERKKRAILHINPLPDCRITLELQFIVPELGLSNQDQCHKTFRVEAVVQQEADLLEHLLIQEVGLVKNTDNAFLLNALDDFDRRGKIQIPSQAIPAPPC